MNNVKLTANNSEALVTEGRNSIALTDCYGAQVEWKADAQTLTGDILVDSISTRNLTLKNGSSFSGTINFNGDTITLADGTVLRYFSNIQFTPGRDTLHPSRCFVLCLHFI